MGQFKPMVKMMTTEPSVILKLKKGGPVKKAMGGTMGQRPLTTPGKPMPPNPVSRPLTTPVKPKPPNPVSRPPTRRGSGPNDAGPGVIERFRDMVGKGGAPKKMAMGGTMGTSLPPKPMPPNPVSRPPTTPGKPMPSYPVSRPLAGPRGSGPNDAGPMGPRGPKGTGPRTPIKQVLNKPAGLAPARMKNGGEMESAAMHAKEKKAISNVEKKLSKHADMPASKGHKGLKTGGVVKGQGGYKTGGVVNGQGGYKNGGAAKKHYATGGVVDSGAPVAMPERKKSAPVAIDRLAGTFKKGGKVRGGSAC